MLYHHGPPERRLGHGSQILIDLVAKHKSGELCCLATALVKLVSTPCSSFLRECSYVSALSEAQGDATGLRDSPQCCACGEARYKMVFQGLWSKQTHPKGFPTGRGKYSYEYENS